MVIGFADILLLVIVFFGVFGSFRGVRAVALTTAVIFFALVVVIFSADLLMSFFRQIGIAVNTTSEQAVFNAVLFVVTVALGSNVLARVVGVRTANLTRREKVWGLLLGLLNGFFIMAVVEHYLSDALQASGGPGVSVGVPALSFAHAPGSNTWSVSIVSSTFTLLPTGANTDLWAKLPIALLLLLLFLAFVFVGTVYGRVSGSRG
jgi:hypothetical protein